ncbi:22790_t:CDS:2, partial [Cetraspora pellucida]
SLINHIQTFGTSNSYDKTRQRNTGSRLIGCPFSVCGVKGNNDVWTLSVTDPTHNHDPSDNMSAHPSLLRPNEQERTKLCTQYNENPLISYLNDTWLPFKTQFVSTWIDSYLHLGNTAMSRIKDAHVTLKKYLQVSTVSKISLFALKQIHKQYLKASCAISNNPFEPCNGVFNKYMDLPYAYIIQECLATNQVLSIDDIYHHWWIKEPSMLLSDPIVQQTRGWPVGSQNKSNKTQASTKRNLSAFELEEARLSGRKCEVCKKTSHNSRTCHESSDVTEI